jgi:hypothetical protein
VREQILHVPGRAPLAAAPDGGERQTARLCRSELQMAGKRLAGNR